VKKIQQIADAGRDQESNSDAQTQSAIVSCSGSRACSTMRDLKIAYYNYESANISLSGF